MCFRLINKNKEELCVRVMPNRGHGNCLLDSVRHSEVFRQLTNREYYPNYTSKLQKFLINKILKYNSYEKQDDLIKEVINSCLLENIDEETLIKEVKNNRKEEYIASTRCLLVYFITM